MKIRVTARLMNGNVSAFGSSSSGTARANHGMITAVTVI